MQDVAKLLVIGGLFIVGLGLLLWSGLGGWIGKLPGDLRIERGGGTFYFPIVTCIVLSILLTVLLALFRR